jgi:hypothetical protein
MLCPVCETRWAPFPEEDFDFVPGKGFYPKHEGAEEKREEVYSSDTLEICSPECEKAIDVVFA